MRPGPERAYLKAAGLYLCCRWQAMGGGIRGCPWYKPGSLPEACLGMRDWAAEMRLIIGEEQSKWAN